MNKKQIVVVCKIKILFLTLLLLAGCAAISKKAALKASRQDTRKKITADVLVFQDLQQIDLDNDGKKEIIALYATGVNSSGVKVIKFSNEKGNIIFENIFDTPNTKIEIKKGSPIIISEESDKVTGCKLKKIYRWDGKTFRLEGKP